MESELFDFEEQNPIDELMWQFYQVTLKVPIDEFPVGTIFEFVTVDYENGVLELWLNGSNHKYKLHLKVGEPIL